ncbi:MAG: acyl-[acyl-carrier-protein]--UDP-N-acetylglucosamine O-acyltransferase, partial [Opitutales bacterium]
MVEIHPTAIVEPGATLGTEVSVGAYAFIGSDTVLEDGCCLHHHACVEGFTRLGPACEVFPFALIGGKTHDLKFAGGRPGLYCGAR